MGIRVASQDVLRSPKDVRVTRDRVTMAGLRKLQQKKSWEDQSTATCQDLLRTVDQVLDKAREGNNLGNLVQDHGDQPHQLKGRK
jgi:hypothetical protein